MKKVLIVGGGFAGVKCALDLVRSGRVDKDLDVTLVSDKTHFEYHAYLYRVVSGRTPLEVCVPLREIFGKTKVKVIRDSIIDVDFGAKTAYGLFNSKYEYDYLILAVGSQTEFYGIPGLKEYSFGFKTIDEALRLKKHIHEVFSKCVVAKNKECYLHMVIVGAGASGVEVAGELAVYAKILADKHKVDFKMVSIDLVEGASRILPSMSEDVSAIVTRRLKNLGVNVMVNKKVMQETIDELYLHDAKILAKTIIWTAGVKTNEFYSKIKGLTLNKKGQVLVNQYLNPTGLTDVFVAGDSAQTVYSGTAQTAIKDAGFISSVILGGGSQKYTPHAPIYAVPVGPTWAIVVANKTIVTGYFGWIIRRLADLRYFLSILPMFKAIRAFKFDTKLTETCEVCSEERL